MWLRAHTQTHIHTCIHIDWWKMTRCSWGCCPDSEAHSVCLLSLECRFYTCVCTCVLSLASTFYTCMYMCVYMYVCVYSSMCVWVCVRAFSSAAASTHMCVYMCVCVCRGVCKWVCVVVCSSGCGSCTCTETLSCILMRIKGTLALCCHVYPHV